MAEQLRKDNCDAVSSVPSVPTKPEVKQSNGALPTPTLPAKRSADHDEPSPIEPKRERVEDLQVTDTTESHSSGNASDRKVGENQPAEVLPTPELSAKREADHDEPSPVEPKRERVEDLPATYTSESHPSEQPAKRNADHDEPKRQCTEDLSGSHPPENINAVTNEVSDRKLAGPAEQPPNRKRKWRKDLSKLPVNASQWHPCSLLSMMYRSVNFSYVRTTKLAYKYQLKIENKIFEGEDPSKKDARWIAAAKACKELLGLESMPSTKSQAQSRSTQNLPSNASEWHPSELLVHMHPKAVFVDVTEPQEGTPTAFKYQITIDDEVYQGEALPTKAAARWNAAVQACEKLFDVQFPPEPIEPKPNRDINEFPPDASEWQPCDLLSFMCPAAVLLDVSNAEEPSLYRYKVTVHGNLYNGHAETREAARQNTAAQACEKVFGVRFVKPLSAAAAAVVVASGSKRRGIQDLPTNAPEWDPCNLLAYMCPAAQYTDGGRENGNPVNFLCDVTVDDEKFIGKGRKQKWARTAAATQACEKLYSVQFLKKYLPPDALKKDPISLLQYMCPSHKFVKVSKAHHRFGFEVIIGNKTFTGTDRVCRIARLKAARQALSRLYGVEFTRTTKQQGSVEH